MDLTQADVADILALLDSLPYDELDLETPRFRLTLRRTPGGWTQSGEVRTAPTVLTPASPDADEPDEVSGAGEGSPGGGPAPAETASMEHRGRSSSIDAPSMSFDPAPAGAGGGAEARAVGGESGAREVSGGSEAREVSGGSGAREVGGGSEAREVGGESGAREADGLAGADAAGEPGAGVGQAELVAVRAPLPGTFYRAPRPGAAPFVEVGSRVGADTVIGIVETMKLMNSVPAGVAGTVAEFCVANAEFAAHGATLLRIRADQ